MSHIFISYAHESFTHLQTLKEWLLEAGFSPNEIWYDEQIEAGRAWREAISEALNEAFVVVIIFDKHLADSHQCTYEWAYAMGQGISIISLRFDDTNPTTLKNPVTSIQYISCQDGIPASLQTQIRNLKSTPPHVKAINRTIYDIILPTHQRFFALGWIGRGLRSLDYEMSRYTMQVFIRGASEAYDALQTFMLEKQHALNGRQNRMGWQLADTLERISYIRADTMMDDFFLPEHIFNQFDAIWLPAFTYFEARPGTWQKWTRRYFERDLNEHDSLEVMAEILRAFPHFYGHDAEILVSNKKFDLSRQSDAGSTD